MPKESPISLAAAADLSRFRGMRHSRPLPTGDKRVLFILVVHLCFLPWALGTMHAWSQATSLVLAVAGFVVALIARGERAEGGDLRPESPDSSDLKNLRSATPSTPSLRQVSGLIPPSAWRRLRRFPPFWLGLALLGYIAVQAFNPAWRYTTNGTHWWLVPVPNISGLPTSVETPFEHFNLWRQFIIYASAWLTMCTVAVGLTKRRSYMVVLGAIAFNALVLALLGLYLRSAHPFEQLLWFSQLRLGTFTFASFIYKNHAGAYLSLAAITWLMLAVRYHERSLREHARSSPALVYALGAALIFVAVVYTYSRGATLLLGAYFAAAIALFALHRAFSRTQSTTPRILTFTVSGMVLFVLVFAVAQLDFRRAMDRFELLADGGKKDLSISQRVDANTASRDMLSNTWPRGVGAGGFRYLYPGYIQRFAQSYQGGQLFWEHAHNDWLETPIELGVVGVGLLLAGGLWWLIQIVRHGTWRRILPCLLALGLLQTLAHAGFDFVFQNPAVLITWLVLAVMAARWVELRSDSADVPSGSAGAQR